MRGAMLLRQPRRVFEFAQLMVGSAGTMTERYFASEEARVWLTGSVSHSDLAPGDPGGAAFGLLLCALSQEVGMPIPQGGAQAISDALARLLTVHGGRVLTEQRVEQIIVRQDRAVAVRTPTDEFPVRRAVLATVPPPAMFLKLVDTGLLPADFVRLVRRFRWGTGVFQLNCALSGQPRFRAEALNDTLVVHLGRSVDELSRGVAAARAGMLPAHPLLITGVHTLADPSRAPEGCHTLWLMTHVPSRIAGDTAGTINDGDWGSAKEAFTERVLDELAEYAPGVRELVLATDAQTPLDLEAKNSNLVGGDIGSGSYALDQQFVFRPLPGWFRYQTPIRGLYMSGAATHPGGGVHGAAGANAARVMLTDLRIADLQGTVGQGVSELTERLSHIVRAGGRKVTRGAARPAHLPVSSRGASKQRIRTAAMGTGPLVQREYAATVEAANWTPEAVMDLVRAQFPALTSTALVKFSRPSPTTAPLAVSERMECSVVGAGRCHVVVAQGDTRTLTLQTLADHPEAGRITIRVEAAAKKQLLVRVRSRTRASSVSDYLQFALVGKHLQAHFWRSFIERLAAAISGRLVGELREVTAEAHETRDDRLATGQSTFTAAD